MRLFWNGQQQVQEVSGGSGFCSQNQRRLHFGVGPSTRVDRVEIHWPSGRVQTIPSPRLNTIHKLVEPT
ncbi:MAG: ASPIC/UnbV domain-containing protein [Acidobacteriaceae bacterium]|nr:ASPIC/UnbV domain-containing protein [Acidobacteriaceae bacterium]